MTGNVQSANSNPYAVVALVLGISSLAPFVGFVLAILVDGLMDPVSWMVLAPFVGVLAFVGFVPVVLGFVGFAPVVLGIVFGGIGISKAPPRRGMSHWGLWLSILGLVWPVFALGWLGAQLAQ